MQLCIAIDCEIDTVYKHKITSFLKFAFVYSYIFMMLLPS